MRRSLSRDLVDLKRHAGQRGQSDCMMNCPRIVVSIFTASVAALSTASAQDITSIPGACEFVVNDLSQQCDSVVYMHVPQTGRTSFNVPTDIGAIAFSGGEDLQPSRNQYILNLDSILAGQDGESRRYPADGRCEVRMKEDGQYVHTLSCSADSDFGALGLSLEGTGEPVQHLSE